MKKLIAKFADKTFVRFVLVGVINTLFGSAIMFVFYNIFHLSYWLSSASNYFFGSILSYFLNKYYTFQYKKRDWKVVVRFAANICLCYLVSYGVAKPIVSALLSGFSVAVRETAQCSAACAFSSRSTTSASVFSLLKMKTVNKNCVPCRNAIFISALLPYQTPSRGRLWAVLL